ncbi:tRNA intron endonuclease [Mycena pura]|uniref:tRNA intron endonuclease n=1 Tax=Mycena pura TaxID=153505 RepID=A0AAD6YLQ6_9AGAR|nr:tRNA intron endonuclease [Mycena pura]
MEAHPSYEPLADVLHKYPRAAGSTFQAYNDIVLVQRWTQVAIVELEGVSRAAISGKKPQTDATLYVVPCSLSETLSFGWLQTAFTLLSDPPEIFLAITSDDASIVYYKICRGIVKPHV